MNYSPEFQPDLGQETGEINKLSPERSPHNIYHQLKQSAKEIAKTSNQEIVEKFGEPVYPLLGENGRLQKSWFGDKDANYDEIEEVKIRQIGFSDADVKEVMDSYQEKYGQESIQSTEDVLKFWKIEQKAGKGVQAEIAVFTLLNKVLGKDFYVFRTTDYDDLCNGADLVIINKNDEEILCCIDVMYDGSPSYLVNSRLTSKKEKIHRIQDRGGSKLKYGLALDAGNQKPTLKPTRLENIPLFYNIINRAELQDLSKSLGDMQKQSTDTENQVFLSFIHSVTEQLEDIAKTNNINFERRLKNIRDFVTKFAD